jgi:hypothetical protein
MISALSAGGPVRRQLVPQKNTTLANAYSALLHTGIDAVTIESASTPYVARCHRCDQPGRRGRPPSSQAWVLSDCGYTIIIPNVLFTPSLPLLSFCLPLTRLLEAL